ncbi:cytochrome P450 [Lonsdalea quercina]|uniref:cytochrome P450 n=1 Tax=Lonsdalea quercina TaxID=71657 RepID=UPI0039767810
MIRPYTALPTVDVDGKRLRAIGILKTVEEAVAAEGDCVRLRFANSADLVVLGGARHVRDWQQNEARFGKDVMTLPSSAAVGRLLLGDALTFAQDGDEWRRVRKLTLPQVNPKCASLQRALTESADWIVEQFATSAPVTLRTLTLEWAVRAVMPPFIGHTCTLREGQRFATDTHQAFYALIQKAATVDRNALLRDPTLLNYRQRLHTLVDASLNGIAEEPDTMLAQLYHALDIARHPERKASLVNQVMGNLSGSIDNPATSLQWCLIHLARHPEVQARIYQEARALPHDGIGLQKCPITLAAVKEALRLTPVSSLVERTVLQDIDIDGYRLPAGTAVLFSPWLVHHDARFWPEPMRFNIDRFLQGPIPPYHYFPFGTGKRHCVGMSLSLHQLVTTLARLSLSCRFQLATGTRPVDLRPEFGLNLAPRGHVSLTATPLAAPISADSF